MAKKTEVEVTKHCDDLTPAIVECPNVPPVVCAIVQFCTENNISTDEEFFQLFDSINWHDADYESAEQFISKFSLAKVHQEWSNDEKVNQF